MLGTADQTLLFESWAKVIPIPSTAAETRWCSPSGDDPHWKPLRIYTDGAKTYIQFPPSIASASAPVLVGLGEDGSWFADPTTQMVNYRMQGDRYVVDRVLDRAALISGVGSSETRVVIIRTREQ